MTTAVDLSRLIATLRQGSKARSHKDIDHLAHYLSLVPYFHLKAAELSVEFLRQCARAMVLEEVQKGQFLYHSGDPSMAIYVLIRGKIALGERELAPGTCFGEATLALSHAQEASAQAAEASSLAALYKTEFFDISSDLDSKRLSDLMGFLHGLPAFARMSRGAIHRISALFRLEVYTRKQVVYRAKDQPQAAYLIKEGEFALMQEVKIEKQLSKIAVRESYRGAKERKKEVIVAFIGPGEFIGEVDIVQDRTRLQSCICNSMQGCIYAISRLVPGIYRTLSRYLKGKRRGLRCNHGH
jgi:CRP-like cAMP-binding protein